MIKTFIDICMYIFEFFIFYYYVNTLFPPRKKAVIRIIFTSLAGVLLCLVYQLNITYINILLIFLLMILLMYFLWDISFRTAVFHSSILMIAMFATEMLTMTFNSVIYKNFNAFESNRKAYLFTVLISKLLYFIVIMIILKGFAKKENREEINKYYWCLFIMPIASMLLLTSMRYVTYQVKLSKEVRWLWIISCIGILLANIVVFFIYEFSIKNQRELYQYKEIKRREEQDRQYYEVIAQANDDMRHYAHDMKNHLIQIRSTDDAAAIHAYVDKLIPSFKKFSATGISKNKMLDLILNKYFLICEAKNIRFEIDVRTANLIYIDDIDLSVLMNNLLDNAVEAAEKADDGFVQISVFSKNDLYDGVCIKNTCLRSPSVENGRFKTIKQHPQLHGIGLSSVNRVVKKYNAVYGWKYAEKDKLFITDIAFLKSTD